jgi:micrococcal nuclease
VVVVAAIVGVVFLSTTSPSSSNEKAGPRTTAAVTRVVDGDTFEIRTKNGKTKRVRILGINTPETAHHGQAGECYADRATAALAGLVDDQAEHQVDLIRDPTQANKDVYGRLLRYVEVNGKDVGAALLRRGAARTRDDHPPVQRRARYLELEDAAQAAERGLWAACA